ncbi:hypothetical protein PENSUB_6595 [Penicillium subrubescens]|uniref:Uncharacterized protein n=1 Tax=Penicillium subrubescens TaxID=1316194 RepID=A0A1Q5U077_9EURO|nr:hypothetical protein PENSUB_6595 [Penicillium subrubescens]
MKHFGAMPPASTLDESIAVSSQDDGLSPSRGVRCQYSTSDEETKNPPVAVVSWTR